MNEEERARGILLSVVIVGEQATCIYDRRDGTSWRRTETTTRKAIESTDANMRRARYWEKDGQILKNTEGQRGPVRR